MSLGKSARELLSSIPKVDQLLAHPLLATLPGEVPALLVKAAVREEVERLRAALLAGETPAEGELEPAAVAARAAARARESNRPRLREVINATGVVVHTNLGRSPLPPAALRQVEMAAGGYSTLEFDLDSGGRGSRDDLIEELLCRVTGAEAATVVNNNAAAVLLALRCLAEGQGAVVSRGELVEIGGAFRIPEVMAASGARLVEVGTTNRTRLEDYRAALTEDVALLMKVHTSNYRIVGFTEEASVAELSALGREAGLPLMVDLGSGSLLELRIPGGEWEPTVGQVLRQGADLVTFSGDKLLGGPQAGIILGSDHLVRRMKKHPLKRALRVGKLTLAALEAVLRLYLEPERALEEIPTLRMVNTGREEVARRARALARRLRDLPLECRVTEDCSRVGGGALPLLEIPTALLSLSSPRLSAQELEKRLRAGEVPVIGRIVDDRFCLDLRTVPPGEMKRLEGALRRAMEEEG